MRHVSEEEEPNPMMVILGQLRQNIDIAEVEFQKRDFDFREYVQGNYGPGENITRH